VNGSGVECLTHRTLNDAHRTRDRRELSNRWRLAYRSGAVRRQRRQLREGGGEVTTHFLLRKNFPRDTCGLPVLLRG
jgi:hypothetical protein